jgi:hypothetical protein
LLLPPCVAAAVAHAQQLEDVDTVHVGDVWHLAAQYEQRRNRRRQQQEQQQKAQCSKPNGRALTPPATSASPEQQQPAAKRARLDLQQLPPLGAASGSGTGGTHSVAHKRASDPGHPQQQQQQQAKDAKSVRAMSEQPAGLSWAPLATPPPAASEGAGGGKSSGDAEGRAAAAELVLRPYKLGPPPDELQQRWDDIAKVRGAVYYSVYFCA